MSDFISRAAVLEDFEACNAKNPHWTPQRVKTLLLRQPAADVAPVVRCKDCTKHYIVLGRDMCAKKRARLRRALDRAERNGTGRLLPPRSTQMSGLRFESMADMPPRMREAYARQIRDLSGAAAPAPLHKGSQGNAKYRNTPTERAGIRFDSRKEARRYDELMVMLRAGIISELRLQPQFRDDPGPQHHHQLVVPPRLLAAVEPDPGPLGWRVAVLRIPLAPLVKGSWRRSA